MAPRSPPCPNRVPITSLPVSFRPTWGWPPLREAAFEVRDPSVGATGMTSPTVYSRALILGHPLFEPSCETADPALLRQHDVIKGGVHREQARRKTIVAVDKTGTLTHGKPSLTDLIPFGSRS